MADNFNITFGVEFEFWVEYLEEEITEAMEVDAEKRFKWHPGMRYTPLDVKLYDLLLAAGVPVNDSFGLSPDRIQGKFYEKWTITQDCSIVPDLPPDDEDYESQRMELVSRVLPGGEESLKEVCTVLSILNANFRVRTNETTGLHVHVGNGRRGFSLPCLKNFAQLVYAFEHQIESLHPDCRVDSASNVAEYCKSLSQSPGLRSRNGAQGALEKIRGQDDVSGLVEVCNFAADRCFAYNFQNLLKPLGKRTIEFRQLQGTTDPEAVKHWIKFTTELVRYSHSAPSTKVANLLARGFATGDQEASVLDFMKAIGCSDLVAFYERRLHVRPRRKKGLFGFLGT
ncbi:hypothetical protein MMC20_002622 [Loxospora ochrophaea]|nr:hypothetical protein [Loxospora ochrophaea]